MPIKNNKVDDGLHPMTPKKHHLYIDGLRAVAIISVILFHANLGISGGYVGVDIFYVISGYLISNLIITDLKQGNFSIIDFWERRVRRIGPALLLVVVVCIIAGWFWMFHLEYKDFAKSLIAQTVLLSNVYFWKTTGYFDQPSSIKPLLHTWTLAVEEQFYLVLPFLLISLTRGARKLIGPAILVLCGTSFGLCAYLSYAHPAVNFYVLPTRAWELLLGTAIALVPIPRPIPKFYAETLSLCGLLGILDAVLLYNSETRFPGFAALLPVGGTALIIFVNKDTNTLVGKGLSWAPLVFVGLISYSLYLWHWPALAFLNLVAVKPVTVLERVFLISACIVMATISWRYVESPIRKRKVLKTRRQIFVCAASAAVLLLSVGVAIIWSQGVPSRFSDAVVRYENGEADYSFRSEISLDDVRRENYVELGVSGRKLPIKLMVWGDSFAMAISPVIDKLCKEYAIRGIAVTHSATAPLLDYKSGGMKEDENQYSNAVIDVIRKEDIKDVILAAYWKYYLETDGESDKVRASLLSTIRALRATNVRVWIMRQVPENAMAMPHALASAVLHGKPPEVLGITAEEYTEQKRRQEPIFAGLEGMFSGVTVLDPTQEFVQPTGRCRVVSDGRSLYWDNRHLTNAGAMILEPLFAPVVKDAEGIRVVQDRGIYR